VLRRFINSAGALTGAAGFWLLSAVAVGAAGESAPGRDLGIFRVTHYYVAEELRAGDWPLFSPGCGSVLSRTSEAFHREISLEGTGRLRDGRLLNFSERCGCARPAFRGNRICYEVMDVARFPWGRGAKFGEASAPLVPFRTVAVDPSVVPLGTVLFVPAWRGRVWPGGRVSDGCVRAEDTGSLIAGRHLDLFVGSARFAELLDSVHTVERVRVYEGTSACRIHRRWPKQG
jgi:3D (Asp-Asp-Asp) domain-containing protein